MMTCSGGKFCRHVWAAKQWQKWARILLTALNILALQIYLKENNLLTQLPPLRVYFPLI